MAEIDLEQYLKQKEGIKSKPAGDVDLEQYLKEKTNPEQPGIARTVLDQGANSASLGYLPQMQAAAAKPIYAGLNALTGQNIQPDSYVDERDRNVKQLQSEEQANPKTAIASKLGGGILGAVATPLPELRLIKGAGLMARAAKPVVEGAAYGAGYGAAQNPGDVEGKVDPVQASERIQNATEGAKYGGVTGAVTGIASKGLGAAAKLSGLAGRTSQEQAVRATGAMLRDFRQLNGRDMTEKLGQWLQNKGVVGAGDTVRSVADKSEAIAKDAGSKLESLYQQAQDEIAKAEPGPKGQARGFAYDAPNEKVAVPLDANGNKITELRDVDPASPHQMVKSGPDKLETQPIIYEPKPGEPTWPEKQDQIVKLPVGATKENFGGAGLNMIRDKEEIMSAARKRLGNSEGANAALNRLETYLDERGLEHGDRTISPGAANDIKGSLDEAINYDRNPLMKQPGAEKAFKAARDVVSKKIDQHIDAIGQATGNNDLLAKLKEANKDYGFAKQTSNMANDRISRNEANRIVSLTDTIAAGAGAAAGAAAMGGDARTNTEGGLAGAALAGLLNHGAKKYGPGVLSSTLNAAKYPLMATKPMGMLGKGLSSQAVNRGLISTGLLNSGGQ